MSLEHWQGGDTWNKTWLSATVSIWTALGLHPGLRNERLSTTSLSYCTAVPWANLLLPVNCSSIQVFSSRQTAEWLQKFKPTLLIAVPSRYRYSWHSAKSWNRRTRKDVNARKWLRNHVSTATDSRYRTNRYTYATPEELKEVVLSVGSVQRLYKESQLELRDMAPFLGI
jgi:hypothetical protein